MKLSAFLIDWMFAFQLLHKRSRFGPQNNQRMQVLGTRKRQRFSVSVIFAYPADMRTGNMVCEILWRSLLVPYLPYATHVMADLSKRTGNRLRFYFDCGLGLCVLTNRSLSELYGNLARNAWLILIIRYLLVTYRQSGGKALKNLGPFSFNHHCDVQMTLSGYLYISGRTDKILSLAIHRILFHQQKVRFRRIRRTAKKHY